MKKLFTSLAVLIVVISICLVFSCDTSTDLAVETIQWESDGINKQFYTNDSEYYSYYFAYYSDESYDLQTDMLTAYIKKNSGSEDWGYGLVFGKQNTDENNQYLMYVTIDGYIHVTKTVEGTTTSLIDWEKMSSDIGFLTGYGIENKVTIWESETDNDRFWINFNDADYSYYFDDTGTVFNSGYLGMLASVGSSEYESFPNTPVDVRIRITSPVSMKSIRGVNTTIEVVNTEDCIK